MRLINIILLFALVITSRFVVAPKSGATQEPEWKRILVLKSTRSDVEKLIGKSKEQGYMAYYPLKEGSVHIEYWDSVCQPGQNDGWNVPKWTVIEVTYNPLENAPRLSSLNLNLERFKKVRESPDVPDLITYINDDEGVAYTVEPDETLNEIRYFPPSRYNNLRCSEQSEGKP